MNDTELCFRALYAAMLYRIKGEGEKSAVADTLEFISPVIAELADMHGKVERGEVDLFKTAEGEITADFPAAALPDSVAPASGEPDAGDRETTPPPKTPAAQKRPSVFSDHPATGLQAKKRTPTKASVFILRTTAATRRPYFDLQPHDVIVHVIAVADREIAFAELAHAHPLVKAQLPGCCG